MRGPLPAVLVAAALLVTLVAPASAIPTAPAPIDTAAAPAQPSRPALGTVEPTNRSGPFLRVQIARRVEVNQPIEIRLTVAQAVDIAGYEATLLFDSSAAEFNALEQRNKDLRRVFGRDVAPLGPVEFSQGVAFGAYSCPVGDCVARNGAARTEGGRGTVALATASVIPRQAGTLQIRLANVKFVTAAGASASVTLPVPVLSVQVGAGGPTIGAPLAPWSLTPKAPAAARPVDLTGDRSVTNADAASVALAWQTARELGGPCGTLEDATRDVNGDGCLDVADAQRVAANYTLATAAAPATTGASDDGGIVLASFVEPSADAPEALAAPITFTVNQTTDTNDGSCSSTHCTLREAINAANANVNNHDTINFSVGSGGLQTIQLASKLPVIDDPAGVTIDGTTQPGTSPAIRIQIRGTTNESTDFDAFSITSTNNVIRGLSIFNIRKAISIYGLGARRNTIAGNYIGTDVGGTQRTKEGTSNSHGVSISGSAAYNTIGGTNSADRNVISGNGKIGVITTSEGTDHNVIAGNWIGLTPGGKVREGTGPDLGNGQHGIDINKHSSYNRVQRNVVSNNGCSGIEVSHGTLTVQNQVDDNYIGTNVNGDGGSSGTAGTGNGCSGVQLEDGSTNNLITNNVIGFNGHRGGSRAGVMMNGFYTDGNVVRGNHIGVTRGGVAIANDLTQKTPGVTLTDHAVRSVIGPGNVIANNYQGVWIKGAVETDYHRVTQNSIFANQGLGIDIYPEGPTANDGASDPDMGPNNVLNFPVLSSASTTAVTGSACAGCRVEVFIAAPGSGDLHSADGISHGEGKTFIGAGVADGSGNFSVGVSGVTSDQYVTATAIDAAGNTSEFSDNRLANGIGGTPGPSPTPSPIPCAPVCASDSFSRTVTDGWGRADIGGVWAPDGNVACGDPYTPNGACELDVNGSVGTMNIIATGSNNARGAYLTNVSVLNTEISFDVKSPAVTGTTAANQYVLFAARRSLGKTEYRGRVQFSPNGTVTLRPLRIVNGTETLLGSNKVVTGLTHQANEWISVRARVTGTNPTRIQMKAWRTGQAEPTGWQLTFDDTTSTTAELQRPGAVGLRAYVAGGTNVPVLFSFDNFLATDTDAAAPPAPTASFTSAQQPGTLTVDFTDSSSGTPTSWLWNFGDASTSTERNPSHTYLLAGTYAVTLTATNAGGSDSETKSITVTAPSGALATDTFTRTVTDSWGTANEGGSYWLDPSGATADFDVNGTVGKMTHNVSGKGRSAVLDSISAQDVELIFRAKTDNLVTGSGFAWANGIARWTKSGTTQSYYRVKLMFGSGGTVRVQVSRFLTGDPTPEDQIGDWATSLTHTAGGFIWLRARVTDSGADTTFQLRAWAEGQTEPAVWQYTATDPDATDLDAPGAVGLQSVLGSSVTNPPIVFSFDDFEVE